MAMASFMPRLPVQALALPELTTTPRSFPLATCFLPITTPGATTLLVVNTAAAVAGVSLTKSPTSMAWVDLIPAWVAPARNPRGESKCEVDMVSKVYDPEKKVELMGPRDCTERKSAA